MKLNKIQKAQIGKLEMSKAALLEKSYTLMQLSPEWDAVILQIREINSKIYDIKNQAQDSEFCSVDQGDCKTRIIRNGKIVKI